MNTKIYIAGMISGDENYRRKFIEAGARVETVHFFGRYGWEVYIRTGRSGFRAVNPVALKFRGLPLSVWPWRVAMAVCLWNLLWCSTVYMLRDWHESRGARIENTVAQWLGKAIIYEEDEARSKN